MKRSLVVQIFRSAIPARGHSICLGHPAMLNTTDSDGVKIPTSVDTKTTIHGVVLGSKVPLVGDLIVFDAAGKRWICNENIGSAIP